MQALLLTMVLALGEGGAPLELELAPGIERAYRAMPAKRFANAHLPRKRYPYRHLTAYPVSRWKHPAQWFSGHVVRDLTLHARPYDYRAQLDYPWYYRTKSAPYLLHELPGSVQPQLVPSYPDVEVLPPGILEPVP